MAFRKNQKLHPIKRVHSNLTSVDLTPSSKNSSNTFLTPKCKTNSKFTFPSNDKDVLFNNNTLNYKKCINATNNIDVKDIADNQNILLRYASNCNSNLNSPLLKSCNISLNSSQNSTINQAELGLREFIISDKTKFLERVCKGPPDCFRWVAWMIAADIEQERKEEIFVNLLNQTIDNKTDIQIKKDLNRTLTDEKLFSMDMSKTCLYNVLRAYANCDKDVSYCQGMNFIAAFLLIVSDFNEVDTLYMMMFLFMFNKSNLGIRGFYIINFPLLSLYSYQFNHLFEKDFPVLKKHFEKLEIPNELWISKWFQTLFTICIPLDILIRLWDCIFVKGIEFLFNFALSLIKVLEKDLIKYNDISDICEYFKSMNPYNYNKNSSKCLKLDMEAIMKDAIKMNISKNLLNNLKLEYQEKFKIDLSFLNVNYDLKSLYNSSNSNKDNQDLTENYNLSFCKSLPQIKFEIKSKFKLETKDVILEEQLNKTENDINIKEKCLNMDFSAEIFDEEICSEFEVNELDIIDNVKMHTLKSNRFVEGK